MKKFILYSLFLLAIACKKEDNARIRSPYSGIPLDSETEALPINEIQVIGSHNSYRLKTDPLIFKLVNAIRGILPSSLDPRGWDYTHIPIPDQLDLGVRSLELDIYNDPAGGRYYNRLGNPLVGKPVASGIEELKHPGMKIIHIPDFDYNTNYFTFKSAIQTLKGWSDLHPQHLPIFVLVELKEETVGSVIPIFTKALPFTIGALDSVDQEIADVFGVSSPQVFRPDDLRGSYANLKEAVQTKGWPTVKDMRGKIIFITYKNSNYTAEHPNLEGRQMFQFTTESSPNAAFIIVDDARGKVQQVNDMIAHGFIVRTRSDEETTQARTGSYDERDAAFTSGSQIISTDYYKPDSRAGTTGWTDFHVNFDELSFARVNIINAPPTQVGKYIRE